MRLSAAGACEMFRYWPAPVPLRSASREPARDIRRLLEKAVEEHLLADVPVARFLSGGIDSSIITALAARLSGRKLVAFSIGFKEAAYDETVLARQVAIQFETKHCRIELSDDEALQIVKEAVDQLDLPSVDALNTYIVARKVADHGVKVALSGLGGDELFGGYPSFRDVPRLKWLARVPRPLRGWFSLLGRDGERLIGLPRGGTGELTRWRRRMWTDAMLGEAGLPGSRMDCADLPDLPDDFARISWIELTHYMREVLLRDSDQMSMAVSLELRVPFLDHELVEFVLGLPAAAKLKGSGVKSLLVEAFRDIHQSSVLSGGPWQKWDLVCRWPNGYAVRSDPWS